MTELAHAGAEGVSSAPDTAIYCVSDKRHFIGLVALFNSLRLAGHDEPLFIVDAGLDSWQHDLLAQHATILPAPPETPPILLAPYGPAVRPARVSIILDVDIVVLRPLTELVQTARQGKLVGFVDNTPHHDRFFPEWATLLDLGPLHRHPYFNAGVLVVDGEVRDALFPRWIEGQSKLDLAETCYGSGRLSDPLYFADQDVLNAVIGREELVERLAPLGNRLAPTPPFRDLRLIDSNRLVCRYPDGTEPYLLHHFMNKPWLGPTRSSPYSMLLPRLLLGADVRIRLQPEQIPPQLRVGRRGDVARWRGNALALIRTETRRQLGRFGIRTRLAGRRRGTSARPSRRD